MSTQHSNNIEILNYDIEDSLPMGKNIFYLCVTCKTILKSFPKESCQCKCQNITVDIDYRRAGFK